MRRKGWLQGGLVLLLAVVVAWITFFYRSKRQASSAQGIVEQEISSTMKAPGKKSPTGGDIEPLTNIMVIDDAERKVGQVFTVAGQHVRLVRFVFQDGRIQVEIANESGGPILLGLLAKDAGGHSFGNASLPVSQVRLSAAVAKGPFQLTLADPRPAVRGTRPAAPLNTDQLP